MEVVVVGDPSSSDDCLGGLLQFVLENVAQQITVALDIISEKYGLKREDLAEVVRDDKRFQMCVKERMGLAIQMKFVSGRKVWVRKIVK
jgi:hypothetical protein